jgi:hypothetical protein
MLDFTQTISEFIEKQFPEIYRDEGQALVAFIKAYYEFLESDPAYSTNLSRQMFDANDIDNSLNDFVIHFKEKYLNDFPFITSTDTRFLVKHIMDYYRSKGSELSLNLLMKLLFNEEVSVYLPNSDVLKPSDSIWYVPTYIEVTLSPRTRTFLNSMITGSSSGATAFVEAVITKRVNGKLIDIVYLSDVNGNFIKDEKVSNDNTLIDTPTIVGSLTSLDVTIGGKDNNIGDIFDVITDQGRLGKVRITGIENATGKVDFKIVNGGYGYTNSSGYTATSVYISSATLNIDNPNQKYIRFEPILQKIEKLDSISSTNLTGAKSGDLLTGYDSSNNLVSSGIVISVANTDASGNIITAPSANTLMYVQITDNRTFSPQLKLVLAANTNYYIGEYIDESSNVSLSIASNTGAFPVGNTVIQYGLSTSNTVISTSFGTIVSSNSSTIVLTDSWGSFDPNLKISLLSNSSVVADLSSVSVLSQGARGTVSAVVGANVIVNDVFGSFDIGNKVKGVRTNLISTVNNIFGVGAQTIRLNGNVNANGVLTDATKQYVSGFVIGQNTTAIGIYGNTSPFITNSNSNFYIETNRGTLISPPRNSNGDIIEANSNILDIKTGSSANFKIGYLDNTETIVLNTDLVGANNVANTPFRDVMISGANSGVGFVANVTVNTGGTLYSNGSIVTFAGGGFANGAPLVSANAVITTDGTGAITLVTVTNPGAGYYGMPAISLPATTGVAANVTTNMQFGYGFTKNPAGSYNNFLSDVLLTDTFTIGTIASLTQINPGNNYNADPFVSVYNKYVASYNRNNFYLYLSNISSSFQIGETLEQIIDLTTTAKGKILDFQYTGPGIGYILVERHSFSVGFQTSYPITGSKTLSTAYVDIAVSDESSRPLGDDAVVTGTVIAANGIATSVEVIDSGYGYVDGGTVILTRNGFDFVISASAKVKYQGKGSGYWKTTTSHLNSEKKIHDNYYYQEYSYDIVSGLSLDKYKNIIEKVLHVAGNALFGSVEKRSSLALESTVMPAVIEII